MISGEYVKYKLQSTTTFSFASLRRLCEVEFQKELIHEILIFTVINSAPESVLDLDGFCYESRFSVCIKKKKKNLLVLLGYF